MKDKVIQNNVDETLWRQAKSQAALEGITLRELIKKLLEEAIREYVEKRKEGK